MYITKSTPILIKEGTAKAFITISNGVLVINDKYKYENDKWYYYGDDGKWYYLGVGANPSIEDDGENIVNQEIYNNIFEKIEEK